MAEEKLTPAGWHPDPEQPHTWRFWDGSRWTDQRAPMQQAVVATKSPASDGTVIAGYLTALLLPFIGWFIAFIIGIVLLARDRPGHGLGVIALSILSPVIWIGFILAS